MEKEVGAIAAPASWALVVCAVTAHWSSVLVVCASTAHSSSVFASSAPARHTRRLCLRRLRHHGTLLLGVCTITAHLSGPSTMLFLKLLPIVHSAPSRHIDLLCAITAHLTLPFRRHSSPPAGPNTMLLLNLLLTVPAPSRHIPSFGLSSAPSRHIFVVVVCAVMAQLSSAILCPSLPAGP